MLLGRTEVVRKTISSVQFEPLHQNLDQLMLIERMCRAERSVPSSDEEFQALVAYDEAWKKATQVIDNSSKKEIQRLIDEYGTFPRSRRADTPPPPT
jgi:hypothetical protein